MNENTKEHLASVKKSYFNILALFLGNEKIESRFLRCLLKWGLQLNFKLEDLKQANVDISDLKFLSINDKVVKLEAMTVAGYFEIVATISLVLPLTLGAYAVIATRARRMFKSVRALRAINRGTGVAMAGAAVAVATR